jgi:hypothetical protein
LELFIDGYFAHARKRFLFEIAAKVTREQDDRGHCDSLKSHVSSMKKNLIGLLQALDVLPKRLLLLSR